MTQLYIIDGYNLLFKITKSYKELSQKKEVILEKLSIAATTYSLEMILVFDGKRKDQIEASYENFKNLRIIHTPNLQSADSFIISLVEQNTSPGLYTIVSSDREVTGKANQLGAHILSVSQFLNWIFKKGRSIKKNLNKKTPQESSFHKNRLQKIFENRLKEDLFDN
jgi:predicted RNA-binding protein with PIN domain